MKSILVFRLSSMGDVLLTLPVLKGILNDNPALELVFVTRKRFVPYFAQIDRLTIIAFDPGGKHRGLPGLWRLFSELRTYRIESVVDLHGVLRTHLLDFLFFITGHPIHKIRKYRKLRSIILKNKSLNIRVPSTADRYLEVFKKAGYTGSISERGFDQADIPDAGAAVNRDKKRIGIAPVSKHKTKNWGLENVTELISLLRSKYQVEIHLFGGIEDQSVLDSLAGRDVMNHAGVLAPAEEISLIRSMDLFISMDSANMHLASLAGVATLSIWGATDPRLGFAPLYQPAGYALFADPQVVVCRPCSVYGEIPCKRFDYPMLCMTSIKPSLVMNKIEEILLKSEQN